jgi:cell division protein FtsB
VVTGFVRRATFWAAALTLALALGSTVAGPGGIVELRRLQVERTRLSDEIFRRLAENDRLREKITRLRRSDFELERLARAQLGLVRDGEIVYRFRSRKNGGQKD